MATYSNYYINGTSLQDATAVYSNPDMTTLAPNGLYSNGVISREQTNLGLGPSTVCPTCNDVFCEENISIEATAPSKIVLLYKLGDNPGAVKVTVIGVNLTAIGLSLKVTPSGGFFNTFSSVGASGYSDNVIKAPSDSVVSYFYPSIFRSACSNWVNGILPTPIDPTLETYSFNPTLGVFMATGILDTYSLANRLSTALPTTVGDLIAYIPKKQFTDESLSVKALYPCASSGKPTVVVECPTTLPVGYNFSLTSQTSAALACSQSVSGASRAHGKVRGTVDGQFKNGDYIFSTVGSVYTKLTDGYYKSLSSNFPEATQGTLFYCTFNSTDGIISEVADC